MYIMIIIGIILINTVIFLLNELLYYIIYTYYLYVTQLQDG
jgi:hypothetical protein